MLEFGTYDAELVCGEGESPKLTIYDIRSKYHLFAADEGSTYCYCIEIDCFRLFFYLGDNYLTAK